MNFEEMSVLLIDTNGLGLKSLFYKKVSPKKSLRKILNLKNKNPKLRNKKISFKNESLFTGQG